MRRCKEHNVNPKDYSGRRSRINNASRNKDNSVKCSKDRYVNSRCLPRNVQNAYKRHSAPRKPVLWAAMVLKDQAPAEQAAAAEEVNKAYYHYKTGLSAGFSYLYYSYLCSLIQKQA